MAVAMTLAAALGAAGSASAHELFHGKAGRSGELGVKGMSEKRLHSFEAAVFGPDHAAEHAQERKLVREGVTSTAAALPPPNQPAKADYATTGVWEQPAFNIPVIGINAMMLPTGKVMWFAYPVNANQHWGDPNAPNTAQAWLWNPATGKYKRIDPPLIGGKPANIWCAGQTFLQDGRVIVVGGNVQYARDGKPFTGLDKVYTFNPWNETWTEQQSMSHGRWYPSVSTLTDPQGHAVIVGGLNESALPNGHGTAQDPDYYNPNLGIDLFTPTGDLDGKGTTTSLGDREDLRDNPNNDYHDPATHAPPDGGLYPHMFQSYNGGTLVAGPDPSDSWVLHQPGAGFNLASHGWDDLPSASRRRLWGTGVLVPPTTPGAPATKVDLLGGTVDETPAADTDAATGNTNSTEVLDQTTGGPWQAGPAMNVHRSHLNTVLLPDSSMVSMGGGMGTTTVADFSNQWAVHDKTTDPTQDERYVDLLKPGASSWIRGAPQNEDRAYHSTAILMPDARVVAAGDDYNGADGPGTGTSKDTAQIYDPPYLFDSNGDRATRPVITSAPASLKYGTNFSVGYSTSDVAKAVLVAPGATTHANDMNQRVVPLQVNSSANGAASIKAPFLSGGAQPQNIAPPGYYMLFVLNAAGTPSVAKWVRVGANPPANAKIQLTQRTTGGSSTSFGLTGAPFDGVSLTDGHTTSATVPGGPSATIPGGHYTITQAARSGFSLKSISCSGGSAGANLSLRRVRISVAAGQTSHCTFTNARTSTSKPSPGKTTPKPKPAPRDTTGPALAFSTRSGLSGRRGLLSGRVRDGSGVKKVQVAVGVARGRKCRWLSVRHKRFAGRSSCAKPRWINAKIKTKKGRLVWVARVHRRLRRGRYLVAIRAYDRRDNVTILAGRKAKHVRVRR